MTTDPRGGLARPPKDHGWVLTAWVLPLVLAVGFAFATAGLGAIFIPIAIVIGLAATAVHFAGRTK